MAFTRTTNVSGVSEIDGIDVSINFSYTSTNIPTTVNFSFTTTDDVHVSGSCGVDSIITYYVNDGIVTDELLELIQNECIRVLDNYDTV